MLPRFPRKDKTDLEKYNRLKMLRNSGYHRVYTAVVTMAPLASARHPGYAIESTVEETIVRFGRDISDEMLLAYVRTREGADKAGGYAMLVMFSIPSFPFSSCLGGRRPLPPFETSLLTPGSS